MTDLRERGHSLLDRFVFKTVFLNFLMKKTRFQITRISFIVPQNRKSNISSIFAKVCFIVVVLVKLLKIVDKNSIFKSGLVVSKLDSRLKGCGFVSSLIQYARWKWGYSHVRINSYTQFWFIVKK